MAENAYGPHGWERRQYRHQAHFSAAAAAAAAAAVVGGDAEKARCGIACRARR